MTLLLDALWIGNVTSHFLRDVRRALKLNETQFLIVHLMGDQDEGLGRPMCPLELAKASAFPATRIVSQLDTLVKAGLVRKVASPKIKLESPECKAPDARRQYYQLTSSGVALARRQAKILEQVTTLFEIAVPVKAASELDRCVRLWAQWSTTGALDGTKEMMEALLTREVKGGRRNYKLPNIQVLKREDPFWQRVGTAEESSHCLLYFIAAFRTKDMALT